MWKVEDGAIVNECNTCCAKCDVVSCCVNNCGDTFSIECEKCKYEND